MSSSRSFSISQDFDVHAEIEGTTDFITFTVAAEYDINVDDPAYDPRSGNSLTSQWCPDTYVEFSDLIVSWAKDTEDLGEILELNNITKNFTLLFSCDTDDGVTNDGEDIRPRITISTSSTNLLEDYKEDIVCICEGYAEGRDVEVDESEEY